MIKIERTTVDGWEPVIRGMRNPLNSWDKSDSKLFYGTYIDKEKQHLCVDYRDISGEPVQLTEEELQKLGPVLIGPNDHDLMMRLAKAGTTHSKFRRMINVTVDITAPFYWWKEFDTYKIGTVANSCSTMHKIQAKEFDFNDFSCEHLFSDTEEAFDERIWTPMDLLEITIQALNFYRDKFNETKDKKYWWQMIQLLPSSYNQKRTVQLNYEVLAGIYPNRKDHKLDEWHVFCEWIRYLPYSEIITLEELEDDNA